MELKLPVADPSPYPPVKVQGKSPVCARAMLQNLGGSSSEMSTVAQYFYNCTVLSSTYPKAAEYFHSIAIVEMHHLSVFAQLAFQLGADPRLWSYRDGRASYWSPGVLTYSHDPALLLNQAAVRENRTVTEYRRLAETLPDRDICAVLNRLILDEEQHVTVFRRLLQELPKP